MSGCGGMVDTLDLGSSASQRGGSSPSIRTINCCSLYQIVL